MSGFAASLRTRSPMARVDARAWVRRTGVPLGLAACIGLAGVSLLAPSAPTYDPWSWIVWGREVLHLDLSTTYGPSWKPLPVALTTVFSLFGGAAPLLWVLTARAGALAGALAAYRLGRRLSGPAAGAAAAIVLLVAPWYLRNAALANSEGLQVAFALAAVERALAGRRLSAFALGLGLGLLRPEAWPFVGLYGLWVVHRERSRWPAVGAGLLSLPLLWLVPEKLGSGDWLRAAHRAKDPVSGGVTDSVHPVTEVLREGWLMLSGPLHWGLVAAVVLATVRRDRRLLAVCAMIAAWTLLVAVMTQHGYSGNARYLIVPAALAVVMVAAALGGGFATLAGYARRALPRAARFVLAAGLAAAAVAPWLNLDDRVLADVRAQLTVSRQLDDVVRAAGGASRVRSCGAIATGAYQVPAVAWTLHLHIQQIELVPAPRSTTLRTRNTAQSSALPSLVALAGRPTRTLAGTSNWRIVTTCGATAR